MSTIPTAESIREEADRRGVSLWQVRKGRGETPHNRTSSDDRVATGLRLSPELHERLRQEAEDRDLSMNWLASKAVEEFLDRLVPSDQFRLTR